MFVAHGMQKLFGMFGGGGLQERLPISPRSASPPHIPSRSRGVTEFVGGLMLVAGALTRYVTAALIAVMLGAIWSAHLSNGFFLNWANAPGRGHGVEYHIVIVAALLA